VNLGRTEKGGDVNMGRLLKNNLEGKHWEEQLPEAKPFHYDEELRGWSEGLGEAPLRWKLRKVVYKRGGKYET